MGARHLDLSLQNVLIFEKPPSLHFAHVPAEVKYHLFAKTLRKRNHEIIPGFVFFVCVEDTRLSFPGSQVSPVHFHLYFQYHFSVNFSTHLISLMQGKFLSETLEMWDPWMFRNKP